ncbi:MAG: hypothetical protein ACPHHR_08145 [Cycloclasticus sp.]|nr:hypothetical protein [Pseudomonadota bacterium]
MTNEDAEVEEMIVNSGHIGMTPCFENTSRPAWQDSVQVIQRIVNLHCDDLLREMNFTREAHDKISEIRTHWTRILQG